MRKRSARLLLLVFVFWLAPDPAWCQVVNYDLRDGLAYYTQGDLEAAIPALERALQADSLLERAYVALGSAYLGTRRYYRAELLVRQGARHFPELKALRVIRAEALMGQQDFEAALRLFKQIETDRKRGPFPSFPDLQMVDVRSRIGQLHQLIANTAVQRGKQNEALTHFEQALRYLPDSLSVYHNVAVLHLEDQNWTEVRDITNQGLSRFPNQTQLLQMKGAALFRLEAHDELEQVYQSLYRLLPDSVTIGITYASVLIQNQKSTDALDVFESLLERFPEDRSVYDTLIDWNTGRLNFPGAMAVLRKMQEHFPADPDVLGRIAEVYEWMDEGYAARAVYDSVAALTGDVLAAQIAKARSSERQDSLDAAIDLYRTALSAAKEKGGILRNMGVLYERQERWNDALETYLQLTEVDSAAYPLIRSAWAYERLDREDEAYALYREAYDQGTRDPLPAFRMAALRPGTTEPDASDTFTLVERAFDLSLQSVQEAQEEMRRQAQESLPSANISFDIDPRERKAELDNQNELAEEIFEYFIDTFLRQRTEPVLIETLLKYPGSGRLHYLVGQFYLRQNELARAVKQFQEAVRFAPELREAHLALGLYYEGNTEDLRAIQSYERALALEPETDDAYAALIPLYRKRNALDQLIDRWRARYRATPENVTLREHLIEALHKAGRIGEAQEIIQNRSKN